MIRKIAIVVLMVPALTLLAPHNQAGACAVDPDPKGPGGGLVQLPVKRVDIVSKSFSYVLADDSFVVGDGGFVEIFDRSFRSIVRVEGTSPRVRLQDGVYVVFFNSGAAPNRAFSTDGVELTAVPEFRIARSTSGSVVRRVAQGFEVRTADKARDTRYGNDGLISYEQIVPPGTDPTVWSTLRSVSIDFDGDELVLKMSRATRGFDIRSRLFEARVAPNTEATFGEATEFGFALAEYLTPLASDTHERWLATTADRQGLAQLLNWEDPDAPTVQRLVRFDGKELRTITSAGDGSGWWIVHSHSPHPVLAFVNSNGTADDGVSGSPLPATSTPATIFEGNLWSPSGTNDLRFYRGAQIIPVKGLSSPSTYVSGGLTSQITRLYQAGLGRAPDSDGLEYWRRIRASGGTVNQISAEFIASNEFRTRFEDLNDEDFVNQLYQFVLDRGPDADGAAYWLNLLETGQLTRTETLVYFSESLENIERTGTVAPDPFAARVHRIFTAFNRRNPTSREQCVAQNRVLVCESLGCVESNLSSYDGSIQQGPTNPYLERYGALSVSDFIDLAYIDVLGRPPDAAGMEVWTNFLTTGALAQKSTVIVELSESAENLLRTDSIPFN